MDPQELLTQVTTRLRALAADAVAGLLAQLPELGDEPSAAGTVLAGRLLAVHDRLPPGNSLVELLREVLGELDGTSPVRLHGWRRAPGSPLGVALVLTDPVAGIAAGCAVLGVAPGPMFDVVVTAGSNLVVPDQNTGPWMASASVASQGGWDAAFGPGMPPSPPTAFVTLTFRRAGHLGAGMADGPGMSVEGVGLTITASPVAVPGAQLELVGLRAAVLPGPLARLVGAGSGGPLTGDAAGRGETVVLLADRAAGLRFAGSGSLRVALPLRVDAPGVQTRGVALTLGADGDGPRLGLSVSLAAGLPGLPVRASLDDAGMDLPVALAPGTRLGLDPRGVRELFPDGIAAALTLPPVSGGGVVRRLPDQSYAGLISLDLAVLRLQATAVFRAPTSSAPTTFLILLAATFPQPGLQLGLGFALDGIGGLVGVNRRIDVTALQRLVSDGNAERLLFPDDAMNRAEEIIGTLTAVFPIAAGRMLIGPMVRLSWGGRIVTLSGALVLELPAPVRAVLVGRLLVAMPDPTAPLVRLQASVLGRVDPSVPVVEVLVSLAGSWIVGLAVRGEMYLLIRGGAQPEFVLSAGGFHPRYVRPPGVPALERLQVDLAPGGGYGMRIEAYFAVTSNAVMFGGQVHLVAMIAGCGVEGWIGLDALFIFDPVFAFSVHVRAGVAVRAFGRRLAAVGLDFTLEGPAPWHAFGTGSISVLFWDVSLDFDVRWGSPPAVATAAGRDPVEAVRQAVALPAAWTAERPAEERSALLFAPEALRRLVDGSLVHPDALIRVVQKVVPLGVPFSRFERRAVPVQQWTVQSVTVGSPQPAETLSSLPERFVPGEFFELSEDQQLTSPAFATHAGGVRVGTDGVWVGTAHRVDDGYETAYEPPLRRDVRAWPGAFQRESVTLVTAAQRLERWRVPSRAVRLRGATLSVAAAGTLQPLLSDVSLVNATAGAWQAVREELTTPQAPVQLLEDWELTR